MSKDKRYKEAKQLVDEDKVYELDEAVELVKKTATAKFDETVELAARLGVDLRHADQAVRGAISLPHGTGKALTRVRLRARRESHRSRRSWSGLRRWRGACKEGVR